MWIHLFSHRGLDKLGGHRRRGFFRACAALITVICEVSSMSLKPLLLLPGLGLVCLLSACAGPLPKADPQQAWIDLAPESPNDLLADSVDGKRLNDGRYFQVSPGQHRLQMALLQGANGNSAQPDCLGRLDYVGFQAGGHYRLVESSQGQDVSAELLDAQGRQVAQSRPFSCL